MHSEQRPCRKGRRANGTFSHRADIGERLSPALAEGTFLAYGSAWLLEEPQICVNFCLQVMKHPRRLFNNYLPVSEQLRGGASSNCFGEYLHFLPFNLPELLDSGGHLGTFSCSCRFGTFATFVCRRGWRDGSCSLSRRLEEVNLLFDPTEKSKTRSSIDR